MSSHEFPNALVLQYAHPAAPTVNFPKLFKRLTVLKVLNAFDCPTTRRDSRELMQHLPSLTEMGVAIVGVCEQPLGSQGFVDSSQWDCELYLDMYKNVCRAQLPVGPDQKIITFRRHRRRSLFQLGGTYLVTPEFNVLYAHEPKDITDIPSIVSILNLCQIVTSINPTYASFPADFHPTNDRTSLRKSWNTLRKSISKQSLAI
ncbi:hypothetical protein DSO57_1003903 [Entomophthora muscae]|uniref:Uncharacterized protein n=1 Tax=Entomophthora muscae TaxID=34485 RepID=A0ACC2SAY7_9FUNG|nr:hypothetical protein DSO57_1003903 [Entomophthora muscae]